MSQVDWERYHELEALDRSGNPGAALSGFRELLNVATAPQDQAAILLAIAACFSNLGSPAEAREAASGALAQPDKASETFAWALLFNAGLEITQGNWAKALEFLDRLEADFHDLLSLPEHKDSRETAERRRGVVLYRLRRLEEAIPFLERAAKRQAERATVLYCLGRCRYDIGDLGGAQEALREALGLSLHPEYEPSAHYVLGLTHHWRGQNARAIEEYRWCLENDKRSRVPKRFALMALVEACKALGQEDQVAKYSEMLHGT